MFGNAVTLMISLLNEFDQHLFHQEKRPMFYKLPC